MLILIGFLLPALIDLLNRNVANDDIRFWISVVICLLLGALYGFITNDFYKGFTLVAFSEDISTQALAMFGIAQISFKGVYASTGIKKEVRNSIDFEK